ncbi:MAG: DUF1207 domain-containing protein [Planctomycetota bacterium]
MLKAHPQPPRTVRLWLLLALSLGAAPAGAQMDDPFLRSSFYGPVVDHPPADAGVDVALFDARAADGGASVAAGLFETQNTAGPLNARQVNSGAVRPAGYGDGYGANYGVPGLDGYGCQPGGYFWQVLPDGLIYRSYMAGPREPRLGTQFIHTKNVVERSQALWDGTVGGRRGIFRYGTGDPLRPEGWQVDLEGAAIVRLNIIEDRDVDASDFRFGVPVTYGRGNIQYKFGYYHLSSHLGDEFIVRTGSTDRVNYVRDALLAGVSYNPTPSWRLYGEVAFAVFTAGGAEPWEFQFGAEYARPGATGVYGTPFFATNAHLREEIDFGGDWTTQLGWLWRGASGSTLRVGLHYMNGKSTQYQFFDSNEEQIGFGAWYDF